jgi:hypothetical protein
MWFYVCCFYFWYLPSYTALRRGAVVYCVTMYSSLLLNTYSMEQSPSWESNRFSASQEILRILWNPTVHYRIHNSSHLSLSRASPFKYDCLIENAIVLFFLFFAFLYLIFVYLCWFCNWLGCLRQDVGKQEPKWKGFLLLQCFIWTPSTLWLKYILRKQHFEYWIYLSIYTKRAESYLSPPAEAIFISSPKDRKILPIFAKC